MSDRSAFGADNNTFGNVFTFMGTPLSRDLSTDVDAVVMGVPYDFATSGRPGARYGPSGIRQASAHLRWETRRWPWSFALCERLNVIDYGDVDYDISSREDMIENVMAEAGRILAAGKKLVTLGGDHFVTLPLLRAVHGVFGEVALLHFDAHTDSDVSETMYDHGTMFHHAPSEGLIDPAATIQVGIRTQYDRDAHPFAVLDADSANEGTVDEIVARIEDVVGERRVYVTFDIDCLDPAFAPGTGTPVAGGLSSSRAMQILRRLGSIDIVAADVMEVAPAYDHADITSLAGATLALEMLYAMADR
jgi:agmatinase